MNWEQLLTRCGVLPPIAEQWAPIFAAECTEGAFSQGLDDIGDFIGQILHESQMLTRLEENLYYTTAARIQQVWPTRFPTVESAEPFTRKPQALAEKVYGGRMGNMPGDGWRCRGSGLIQITGSNNLRAMQEATGIPVFDNPELLRNPSPEALRVCIAWWEGNVPDALLGDVKRETKVINGGYAGLTDRQRLILLARDEIAKTA
jgi:putative chitinase